jgi:hypothetical protein
MHATAHRSTHPAETETETHPDLLSFRPVRGAVYGGHPPERVCAVLEEHTLRELVVADAALPLNPPRLWCLVRVTGSSLNSVYRCLSIVPMWGSRCMHQHVLLKKGRTPPRTYHVEGWLPDVVRCKARQ